MILLLEKGECMDEYIGLLRGRCGAGGPHVRCHPRETRGQSRAESFYRKKVGQLYWWMSRRSTPLLWRIARAIQQFYLTVRFRVERSCLWENRRASSEEMEGMEDGHTRPDHEARDYG